MISFPAIWKIRSCRNHFLPILYVKSMMADFGPPTNKNRRKKRGWASIKSSELWSFGKIFHFQLSFLLEIVLINMCSSKRAVFQDGQVIFQPFIYINSIVTLKASTGKLNLVVLFFLIWSFWSSMWWFWSSNALAWWQNDKADGSHFQILLVVVYSVDLLLTVRISQ